MDNSRLCVVTGPLPQKVNGADIVHITNLLNLLLQIFPKLYLISLNFPKKNLNNNKIKLISSNSPYHNNMILRIITFILMQIKVSYEIIRIQKKVDVLLFSIGAVELFLPILTSKLFKKKVFVMHPGKGVIPTFVKTEYNNKIFGNFYIQSALALEKLSYSLSDQIIVHNHDLQKYAKNQNIYNKIVYGSRFYIDSDTFNIKTDLTSRRFGVSYIGKFTEIKGVMNFVSAIPIIEHSNKNVEFFVCGDGTQKDIVVNKLNNLDFKEKIQISAWIDHKRLPEYLNKIKILVIPSKTEVGPQILLEAMACGTIVLSTKVGIVEHTIKDGENGFLLENNSPECIAQNILRIINDPHLDEVSRNARRLVEENYSLTVVSKLYKEIIEGK